MHDVLRSLARVGRRYVLQATIIILAIFIGAGGILADTLFDDEFSGSTLNAAWQILPGNGSYAVTGGQLQYTNAGPQASTTGWYSAALTLALPFTGTNWEIDTKATYNLFYLDSHGGSSGAQGPEVLVKFNNSTVTSPYGGPNYAGTDFGFIERDIDAGYGSNYLGAGYGSAFNSNLLNPADSSINNNVGDGTYWYKITRDGGLFSILYSYDGVNYMTALTAELSDPTNTFNELLIGGITYESTGSYTDYDYVRITNVAPEPGTFRGMGLGLAVYIAIALRRRLMPTRALLSSGK